MDFIFELDEICYVCLMHSGAGPEILDLQEPAYVM